LVSRHQWCGAVRFDCITPAIAMGVDDASLLPGNYSGIGRITELTLKKLKDKVDKEDADLAGQTEPEEPLRSRKSRQPEPEEPPPVVEPQPLDASALLNSTLRSPKGDKLRTASTLKESGFSRSMKEKWLKSATEALEGSDSPDSNKKPLAGTTAPAVEEESIPEPKPTISFSTSARSAYWEEQLDPIAGELYRRFQHPASLDQKPPICHYHVNSKPVHDRYPEWDFGEKEKHLPIRPIERDTGAEPGESFSSLGNPFSRSSGLQQMGLGADRPPVGFYYHGRPPKQAFNATSMRPEYKEWQKRDEYSSKRERYPDWDVEKHSGSHSVQLLQTGKYFDPGKYKYSLDVIAPVPKSGIPYKRAMAVGGIWPGMSRSMTDSKLAPKAVLHPEAPYGKALKQDRSLSRGCSQTVPRKTCLQDFGKDMDRPPLSIPAKEYYDVNNPEASARVLHQQMTFDASTADNYIITRKDYGPDMQRCMPRKKSGMGVRIFQNHPVGLRHTMGVGFAETSVDERPVEAKEAPYNRTSVGMSFKQTQGRYKKPAPIASPVHSSLGGPKDGKTFHFTRSSHHGFTSGSTEDQLAARKAGQTRPGEHDEVPDWDNVIDDAEGRAMPSAPPLKTGMGFSVSAMDRQELLASYQAFCEASEGQMLSQEEFEVLLKRKAPKMHLMVSSGESGPQAVATLLEQFEQAQMKLAGQVK